MLPCCEFPSSSDTASPEDYTLTLLAKHTSQKSVKVPPAPEQPPRLPQHTTVSMVPPPPGFETH